MSEDIQTFLLRHGVRVTGRVVDRSENFIIVRETPSNKLTVIYTGEVEAEDEPGT